jgi:hypothetical protein
MVFPRVRWIEPTHRNEPGEIEMALYNVSLMVEVPDDETDAEEVQRLVRAAVVEHQWQIVSLTVLALDEDDERPRAPA